MSYATATSCSAPALRFHSLPFLVNSQSGTSIQSSDAQQRADESRNAQAETAIAKCRYLTGQNVSVHVNEGLVRLTGRVGSYYEKQQATVAIQSVVGTGQIENVLKVCR